MSDFENDRLKQEELIRLIEEGLAYQEHERRKTFRRTMLLAATFIATATAVILEFSLLEFIRPEFALAIGLTIVPLVLITAMEYYSRKTNSLSKEQRFLRSQMLESESSKDINIINRLERIDYELSSLRSFQSEILERRLPPRETTEILKILLRNDEELKEMLEKDIYVKRMQEVRPPTSLVVSNNNVANEINPERLIFMYNQVSSEFAHSIKAPLASIDAALTNLSRVIPEILEDKKNGLDGEALVELLQNASSSVELIRSILKQGAGFNSVAPEEIDLSILVRKAERLCRDATNSKSALTTDFEVTKFVYYRLNLFIGIVELLRNAFEAAGDDGHIKVTSDYKPTVKGKHGRIEILITNDGKTISDERMSYIFDAAFSTKGAGHGLGLKVVKDSLNSANGNIEILKNTNPKLTTFRITFEPLEQQTEKN